MLTLNTGVPYTPNPLLEYPFELFKTWAVASHAAAVHEANEATAVRNHAHSLAEFCRTRSESMSIDAREAYRDMLQALRRLGRDFQFDDFQFDHVVIEE